MTVIEYDAKSGLATCAPLEGAPQQVEAALVEPLTPGERLLVHAGTAIAKTHGAPPPPAVTTFETDASASPAPAPLGA
jgi:hypothetical protein